MDNNEEIKQTPTLNQLIEDNIKYKVNNENLQEKLLQMQLQINDLKKEIGELKFIHK
jgi:hypothetical protein